MPAPRVTVLTTLYNKAPFVKATVQSILDNTFKDLEYLVVDDASTDGGLELVKAIADPRLKVLESPVNTGRAASANRGYDAAQGEYVAVLDADDIAGPERLAKQVAFLDSHPDVGVVGSWAQTFGNAHGTIKRPASDPEARAMALFGVPVLYPSSMFRRSVLERYHLRCDPDWLHPGMDRLFMINVGRHTRYANLQDVLLHYRVGPQNMRHGRDAISDMHHLYRAVFELFGIPVSAKQIALQTLFHPELDGTPPSLVQLVELARWKKELTKTNRQHAFFPVQEFEAYVEQRWQNLFHQIVQANAPNAFLHMWLTGKMRERTGYWAKVTSERWFKRPFH